MKWFIVLCLLSLVGCSMHLPESDEDGCDRLNSSDRRQLANLIQEIQRQENLK